VASFRYAAVREDGEAVVGEMEARDQQAVLAHLDALSYHPIEAVEVGPSQVRRVFGRGRKRPSANDLALFSRELGWLLRAGLVLSRALEILSEEGHLPRLAKPIAGIRAAIRTGQPLHEALAEADDVFTPYYVNMIRMAEASGTLVPVLERIADSLEREQKVWRKIVSASTYPALLVCLATGALLFILLSVVPNLKDLIVNSGADVPEPARLIIALSDWLAANGWWLLVAVLSGVAASAMALRQSAVRRATYAAAFRLPGIGHLLQLALVVRFSRTLATLLSAGVYLPTALSLMRPAFDLREVETVIEETETALRRGEDYLLPLERSRLFPRLFSKLLRVGGETGNLAPSVQQASAIFEDKLDIAIERSLSVLEPLIIIVVSIMIAAIISSIMSAIISVNDLAL
jgi:general secretion pathway protein F